MPLFFPGVTTASIDCFHTKLLPVRSRKLLFVQANTESAFAGYGVISLTTTARIVLDVSRCLVEVGDLLHEMFIVHMLSCGKKHGSLRFRQGNGSPSGSKEWSMFICSAVMRRYSLHTSGFAAKARIVFGVGASHSRYKCRMIEKQTSNSPEASQRVKYRRKSGEKESLKSAAISVAFPRMRRVFGLPPIKYSFAARYLVARTGSMRSSDSISFLIR